MGYNKTVHAIQRIEPQLKQLLSERRTLDFPTSKPARLAHRFREALVAAAEFDEYHEYAALKPFYRFRELNGGVRAEYIGEHEPTPMGIPVNEPARPAPAIAPERKQFPEVRELLEVLAIAAKFGASNSELYFPSVHLSPLDKQRLFNWTSGKEWKYIDHHVSDGEGGITLTKKTVPEEILFHPSKMEEE